MEDLDVITLSEAGKLLGRSADTLRTQVHRGRLQARLIGKTWVTTRAEVERYRRESLGKVGRPGPTGYARTVQPPTGAATHARPSGRATAVRGPSGTASALKDPSGTGSNPKPGHR
jgi:hypothetical protein